MWLEGTPGRGLWGGKARGARPLGDLSGVPAPCLQVLLVWPQLTQDLPPWERPPSCRLSSTAAEAGGRAHSSQAPAEPCMGTFPGPTKAGTWQTMSLFTMTSGWGKRLLSLHGVKGLPRQGKDGPHAVWQGGAASSQPGLWGSAESARPLQVPL